MTKKYKISIPVTIDFEGNNMSPQNKNIVLTVSAGSLERAMQDVESAFKKIIELHAYKGW